MVDITKGTPELNSSLPAELPVLPLISAVIFPQGVTSLHVRLEKNIRLLEENKAEDQLVCVVAQKESSPSVQKQEDLYKIGVAARVIQRVNMPNHTIQAVFHGLTRVELEKLVQTEPFFVGRLNPLTSEEIQSVDTDLLIAEALGLFERLVASDPRYSPELVQVLRLNLSSGGHFADLLAGYALFPLSEKQQIIETLNTKERLYRLVEFLNRELSKKKVESELAAKVEKDLEKNQREYYLRQELAAIKQELGEKESEPKDVERFRRILKKAALPADVKKEADEEIGRLEKLPQTSPEYHVVHNYLDWMVHLPWNHTRPEGRDLKKAEEVLNADHFGLDKVKERILEFLAVRALKKDTPTPLLCFVGPPGVGKTSLGRSIARATGRPFVGISVGGMRDEAEIKGHRRTYVGAMPGKIIQGLRRAKSKNPVFMLDEIDKLGVSVQGDPAAALLEVFDPEQNRHFRDYFLDLPFDLSQVMFLTTANLLDPIPPALRDRLEVIRLPGYTNEEKLEIANRYLLPQALEAHGITKQNLVPQEGVLEKLLSHYTREAGVREFSRLISLLARKAATQVAKNKRAKLEVTTDRLEELLGPTPFVPEVSLRHSEVGVASGLAWTSAGGELLFIEATRMRGKGKLTLTGHLGEVMSESVQAALSYVRSHAAELGIASPHFERSDLHVHFPEGATPKDGPSAGLAVVVALASLFSEKPVRHDLAMSGEITLRGKILPVGGIKEKVLAAYRAGIAEVILPEGNKKDLPEIPAEVRAKLTIAFVSEASEAIERSLINLILPKPDDSDAIKVLKKPDKKS
ncbi:MAG: endopeptidase La [candidate division Zixibacteria bacterium]|nr:endopeptidase La [candidate division Zixibacteria bacterium]